MSKTEFLKALQQDLALDQELTGTETLDEIGWDSMSSLSFVALSDSKLGLQISGDQLAGCKTVNDLLAIIGSKLD